METLELPKTEVAIIAERIDNGLVAFEQRKQLLTDMQQRAHGLKITSIEDKVSINTVSTMRKELKAARVEIEKEGKAMRDPLTRLSKHIISKEGELVAIIEPTERELQQQEKWVEDEKEKIRLAAEEAEKQRIQTRIDKLAAFGFAIDYAMISTIDDESFGRVLANAAIEFEKEQAAKAEQLRLDALEKQRIEDEKKELEELRKKQAEAQAIIDKENARIKKEQEEKEAKILAEQKRLKDEADAIELKKKQAAQAAAREKELQKAREDAAEKARLKAIEDAKEEAEQKEREIFAAKVAAEKEAALRPDKEKLQSFSDTLSELKIPVVANPDAQLIVNEIQLMINKMQAHILRKIKSL